MQNPSAVAEFAHLHVHSQYSLLDGAIRVGDLYPRIQELGMDTVAVTDHGNMFGAVDTYTTAKKYGVKPIFGCETYISASDRHDRTNRRSYHMVLLAKNEVGYKNLTYLNSMGYLEGFYYNPRIDKELLRKHSDGLIGLSACLGGEVSQALMKQGTAAAEEVAKEYQDIFAPGDFYLEMMPNGLTEQDEVNASFKKMGPKLGIPLVATNDCHYVNRTDAHAHEILLSIQTGKTASDEKRLRHVVDEYFIKSPAEMAQAFHDCPEALENAAAIAGRCNVELDLGNTYLPQYKVPDGFDLDTYLERVILDGLDARYKAMAAVGQSFEVDEYRVRAYHELGVIKKMGFSGYFLIVWDFIRWAKEQDIPVGPGRGSGAGSLVAYAMGITDIDPIRFKLLFERFLNPERVSMPDFDIDFCMKRRDEVIRYVQQKYGHDKVGQIATFHQLKARGVIRDISRVMELPYSEADKLAKLIPDPVQGKSPPVKDAIEQEPELKRLYNEDPKTREILDVAQSLEGLNRHVGMHAAGVVIAEKPLWEYVPCFKGQNGEIVSQFAMKEVEKAGLVKFDFLGLKTLTVIDNTVKAINEQRAVKGEDPFDISLIPADDADVYKMISSGDTTGVFQMESSGFRDMLMKLKPDQLEDIVAAGALYRPGPLEGGMVDDFIDRKHGRQKVEYLHPDLEEALKDTYGVIVYQEQVMQIARVLAGYSLGRADLLRRAMGKKIKEVMGEEKIGFVDGAVGRGVDKKIAEQVFDLMAFFAGYGFNRSHSAAYGWISYQTAYLKYHFPHEFVAGLMTCDQDNTDNIVKFISEARSRGLTVERPDVNESAADFTVVPREDGKVIRFGLGAIKGIGSGAVEAIVGAREEGGPFTSMFDFGSRVDTQKANRRVVEALVKSGAFDGMPGEVIHRARLFSAIDGVLERAAQAQRDRRSGQTNLFGLMASEDVAAAKGEVFPMVPEWSQKELLALEKESLGFYISGHPLDRYVGELGRYATASASDFTNGLKRAGEAKIGGVVSAYRERPTKRGNGKIAFFQLEDQNGSIDVVVFPKSFDELRPILVLDEPLLCSGRVVDEGEGGNHSYKMLLSKAVPLGELRKSQTRNVEFHLDSEHAGAAQIEQLKQLLIRCRGSCEAVIVVRNGNAEARIPLGENWRVAPSDELISRADLLFGGHVTRLI